ncbi:MAG: hypothetical protein GX787_07535 [Tissierellia bacterium]|jgi:uncharacterized membrane protein HdeD (DUF308 family)|nr:hypothetical protein [Tissierellia bacterium]
MDIRGLKIRNKDIYSMIFSGILYFILGILFLVQKQTVYFAVKGFLNLLIILFVVAAIFQIIGFSPVKNKNLTSISRVIGFLANLIMASILYFKPEVVVALVPIFFGIYAISSGIIRILIYIQYRRNNVGGRILVILGAIILIVLGTLIITHPLTAILPISNIIGLFFVFYGISFIMDGLIEGLSIEVKDSFKRRIRISLPVFMVALIPHNILMKINKSLETEELNKKDFVQFKENTPFDLEVLIHVAETGTAAFGHVDIWFDGKVMTYGSYDEDTYKFRGAISDGVFIEIDDKQKYIEFSQKEMDKTMFGFGLKLTEEQKERVQEKIDELKENLYQWKPKSMVDEEKGIEGIRRKDYASKVYDNLKGKFYKFIKGPFKTYFVMNTNCVLLADKIVGQSGIDLVKIQGLISPGAYFEFFNREFSRKNSFVISRSIYYKEDKNKMDQ